MYSKYNNEMNLKLFIQDRYSFKYGKYAVKKQIGSIHKREKRPCQDACKSYCSQDGNIVITALSDGHGDKKHDLSHIGAELAVSTSISLIEEGIENFKDKNLLQHFLKYDFPRLVVRRWRKQIRLDAKRRLGKSYYSEHNTVHIRYGTTLIVTAVIDNQLYFAQLGDGMIIFIGEDGDIELPFYGDDRLRGNETFSLASRNAVNHFRITQWERPRQGGFLFLCTDGLVNSFATDQDFYEFSISLYFTVRTNPFPKVVRSLPVWFSEYSSKGSGDDIAAGMIYFQS